MLKYFAQCQVEYANPRGLHLTYDEVSCGGDENNVFLVWLPAKDLVVAAPIQVSPGLVLTGIC